MRPSGVVAVSPLAASKTRLETRRVGRAPLSTPLAGAQPRPSSALARMPSVALARYRPPGATLVVSRGAPPSWGEPGAAIPAPQSWGELDEVRDTSGMKTSAVTFAGAWGLVRVQVRAASSLR